MGTADVISVIYYVFYVFVRLKYLLHWKKKKKNRYADR